jgi:branched-chain amino acid transport system permease protein
MKPSGVPEHPMITGPARTWLLVLLIGLAIALPQLTDDDYYLHVMILMEAGIIMASSFRLMFLTGSLSIAHASFAAIGSYASALMVMRLGLPFWASLPLAGLIGALVAVVLGYPALRTKGIYFAIVTLGIVEITNTALKHFGVEYTGGSMGLTGVPRPGAIAIPGIALIDFSSKVHYYYLALALLLVSIAILYWLERSRFGATVHAICDADPLASSVGINVTAYMLATFAITAFFASITGAFMVHYVRIISPFDYTFAYSTKIITYAVIGGINSFSGPVVGAVFLTAMTEALRGVGAYYDVMGMSIVLVLVLLFLPGGLVDIPRRVIAWRRARAYGGSSTDPVGEDAMRRIRHSLRKP